MAVVCLTSATGAPGVTTTALGLLGSWPRDVVLLDADRDAGRAVLAGFLRGQDAGGRGLGSVAAAHRERRSVSLLDEAFPIVDDPHISRLFIPGFAHPSAVALFGPVWPDLAQGIADLNRGYDVLLDAGRVGSGLPEPLLDVTDMLLVIVRSDLRSLAALGGVVGPLADHAERRMMRRGLIVVGAGRPYDISDISAQFGWPVLASIPWDPTNAAVLSDGADGRRFERTALRRGMVDAASELARMSAMERVS